LLMITKKLIIIIFKWCVVFFITIVLLMHLVLELMQEKAQFHITKQMV
jgi:hypothetical protein